MNGSWYDAREHLPEEGRRVIGYSAVYGRYYLTKFFPYRGWVDGNTDEDLSTMTHWLDMDLPFNFPINQGLDRELALQIGLVKGETNNG